MKVDLEASFQRAMRARHMPLHSALNIIDTSEILLERIIGQGSFGRVWCGKYRNDAVAVKEFVFAQVNILCCYIFYKCVCLLYVDCCNWWIA